MGEPARQRPAAQEPVHDPQQSAQGWPGKHSPTRVRRVSQGKPAARSRNVGRLKAGRRPAYHPKETFMASSTIAAPTADLTNERVAYGRLLALGLQHVLVMYA